MYSPYMRNKSLGPPGPVGKTTRIGFVGQPSICSAKLGPPMRATPKPALADRNTRRVSISDPPVSEFLVFLGAIAGDVRATIAWALLPSDRILHYPRPINSPPLCAMMLQREGR